MNDEKLYRLLSSIHENCYDNECGTCIFAINDCGRKQCQVCLIADELSKYPSQWDMDYIKELIEK